MRRPPLRRLLGAALVVAGFALLVLVGYLASVHAFAADSDGATVALEGQAMAHGQWLLAHWAISLDSFWLIDALFYTLGTALLGLHPVLLHLVPAVIAALVVVVGVVLATEHRTRWPAVVAGATVVVLLALPSHALAYFLLRGPLHVGTTLWCLAAFAGLRRGRFGWGWAVAVLFLAAGLLGDLQMAALGVVPVALAGVSAAARTRSWRAGLPLVAAGLAALALAEVVRRIARALGTFSIAKANPIATFAQMEENLHHGAHEAVLMLGVGSTYYGLGGVPSGLADTHLLAVAALGLLLACAVVALVIGVAKGRPTVVVDTGEESWRLDDLLLFATVASPAAYLVLAASPDYEYARYLTAGIVFAAVLAGRVAGRLASQLRWQAASRVLAGVGLAASCCYAAGFAVTLAQPVPVQPARAVGAFLEAHHLDEGLGAYWISSIVTVQTSGEVTVRPVVSRDGVHLARYDRNSSASWYGRRFEFLVFDLAAPWGGVDWKTAVATFGPPKAAYTVDGAYRVMVWPHPVRLGASPG